MSSETEGKARKILRKAEETNNQFMERTVRFSKKYATDIAYLSFAFIFIYFGLQKPLPVFSPVSEKIALLGYRIGTTSPYLVYFVGFYEIFLGLLFLFRLIKQAFWFFLAHQIVTFASLFVLYKNAFQAPWITVLGIDVPIFLSSYSAFVLKNLVFVACFLLLFKDEYRERTAWREKFQK